MSKFKVGDKVVFNREKAQKDIDRLAPGADSWLDSVPKGPLTIKEAVGTITVRVEECCFSFSTGWLDKYEEPVRVGKFKVGDKVYTVDNVTEDGGTIILKEDEYGFLYSPHWLDKVEEGKCEVKVSEGRIKDVKFSGPATIVFWTDGTKTVVKCRKGDKFDPEKGIAMACAKKLLGNEDGYHKEIAKYAKTVKTPDEMRMELKRYCHGKWCSRDCVIGRHRKDPRCVCGMGYSFTTDKDSSAYIKDDDIRVFYKWMKEGLENG